MPLGTWETTTASSTSSTAWTLGSSVNFSWVYVEIAEPPAVAPKTLTVKVGNIRKMGNGNIQWASQVTLDTSMFKKFPDVLASILDDKHDIWKSWKFVEVPRPATSQHLYGTLCKCSYCGKIAPLGRCGNYGDIRKIYCQACAPELARCFVCQDGVYKKDASQDSLGQWLCPNCAPGWRQCNCRRWTDEPEGVLCVACRPRKVARTGDSEPIDRGLYQHMDYIHDYAHKPAPHFHVVKGEDGTLVFGVELETDGFPSQSLLGRAMGELHKLDPDEDLFYGKRDGSIHSGVEIVTHPCTLKFHQTKFPWAQIRKIVLKNKGRSHETKTCGMHVHFNVSFMGANAQERDLNTLKLLHFVEKFWSKLLRFSRRNPDEVHRWARRYYDDFTPVPENLAKVEDAKMLRARHMTVNLVPDKTIEIRIFKGSLNPITILGTIEFLDYLLHLLKASNATVIQQMTWKSFVDGVDKTAYPNLVEYLERRRLNVPRDL
uniref:Putative amidoligase enzyme n=1 Tax=viral metagenome TaxID=1070528 RepID=A0A6M3XYT6_9ZZZZ